MPTEVASLLGTSAGLGNLSSEPELIRERQQEGGSTHPADNAAQRWRRGGTGNVYKEQGASFLFLCGAKGVTHSLIEAGVLPSSQIPQPSMEPTTLLPTPKTSSVV